MLYHSDGLLSGRLAKVLFMKEVSHLLCSAEPPPPPPMPEECSSLHSCPSLHFSLKVKEGGRIWGRQDGKYTLGKQNTENF